MALIKKAVDTVNKRVQFAISESCNGIAYEFTGGAMTHLATISVILVQENEPNQLLYKFQKSKLFEILNFHYGTETNIVPFSLDGDLKLSKSNHILVEFDFNKDQEAPTEIQYETILSSAFTEKPIEIKTIPADGGEIEFSTENYNIMRMLSVDVLTLTANLILNDGQKTSPKMVRYPSQYLVSLSDPILNYTTVVLPHDTKVSATANSAVYLVKF